MKVREFLENYAKRYPEHIKDPDTFITATNAITIDYADGIFTFFEKTFKPTAENPNIFAADYRLTGKGGHNGCILEDEEYYYLWDNIIGTSPKFMAWYTKHGFGHHDFMVINIEFNNTPEEELGRQDVEANFFFYEGIEE